MKTRIQQMWMMIIGALFVPLCAGALAQAQPDQPYVNASSVVQQTMHDLQRAQSADRGGSKDQQRTDQAIKRLSEFDHRLAQHHFDQDKLNSAIKAVSDVSQKNHLEQPELDAISGDANELRRISLQHKNSH